MKARNGFVSNSSSSSFVIPLSAVNSYQMEKIRNHVEACDHPYDAWEIRINEFYVMGYTSMDNFDMHTYLVEQVGIDPDAVSYGGGDLSPPWGASSFEEAEEIQDRLKKYTAALGAMRNIIAVWEPIIRELCLYGSGEALPQSWEHFVRRSYFKIPKKYRPPVDIAYD